MASKLYKSQIAILGISIILVVVALIGSRTSSDEFEFLLSYHPLIQPAELGSGLSPKEISFFKVDKASLYMFQSDPNRIKDDLSKALVPEKGWIRSTEGDDDWITWRNNDKHLVCIFGVGLPRAFLKQSPQKTPTCFTVIIKSH